MRRVLVVDDSAVYRKLITRMLSADPDNEIVGYAADPYQARDRIAELRPDVVTLDVEMPKMDGLAFLEKLMASFPLPVVLLSTLGIKGGEVAVRALALGAVEVVAKPGPSVATEETARALLDAVRVASSARIDRGASRVAPIPSAAARPGRASVLPGGPAANGRVVVIGASTGGTRAIEHVLRSLPANLPPIVVVIHMPPGFTAAFAGRLKDITPFDVHEADDQEVLTPGAVLVAPAGRHARLVRGGGRFAIRVYDGPAVKHHRPNIDVFFHSVAEQAGARAMGVLLTGMGEDGARGLLNMRSNGAFTVAEAEESCVVYGMPRVAAELGAVVRVAPLSLIPGAILEGLRCRDAAAASVG
ncbi:MAG: chemotaxis response regulator protein-glutamate methylesterase [Myxococcales bacterium]|nr:chemotaxis response regulator protein-glutamate methylesterase [Myxococcales bacterium]